MPGTKREFNEVHLSHLHHYDVGIRGSHCIHRGPWGANPATLEENLLIQVLALPDAGLRNLWPHVSITPSEVAVSGAC